MNNQNSENPSNSNFVEYQVEQSFNDERIDRVLNSVCSLSRNKIQELIKLGFCKVNNQIILKPNFKVFVDDFVILEIKENNNIHYQSDKKVEIVFQDKDLVVINKPINLIMHPAPGITEETLVHRLLNMFPEIASMSIDRPGIVHRLDKDTSGLLTFALNEETRLSLTASFAGREVHKEYLAIVYGVPKKLSGTIEASLGRDPKVKSRMAVVENGKEARSDYQVIWSDFGGKISLVRVRIYTGRTHQVRVHLRHLGHPIVGDKVYSWDYNFEKKADIRVYAKLAKRPLLHAWYLSFAHPHTNEKMEFRKSPPKDFYMVLTYAQRAHIRLGLTGMPGSGKSTVLSTLKKSGVPVWSADKIVNELYKPGAGGWQWLYQCYGTRFIPNLKESVDKKILIAEIIKNPHLRKEIESAIHPMVFADLENFYSKYCNRALVCAEIPLLAETGVREKGLVDLVAILFTELKNRQQRLVARGVLEETAQLLDSWHWTDKAKLLQGNFILDNNSSISMLEEKTTSLLGIIRVLRKEMSTKFICKLNKFFESADFDIFDDKN